MTFTDLWVAGRIDASVQAAMWGVRIPMALVLVKGLGLGAEGVYAAMLLSWMAQAGCSLFIYRRGKWLESGLGKRHTGRRTATVSAR